MNTEIAITRSATSPMTTLFLPPMLWKWYIVEIADIFRMVVDAIAPLVQVLMVVMNIC